MPGAFTQSFPKQERIAKRRDFVRVYEEGRKLFGRHAVVFVSPNNLGHPRLGITVTKKTGKSHDRNRLKRWVREIYRRQRAAVGLENQSLDLVVNVKASAASATFAEFSEDVARSLGRAVTGVKS